MAISVIIFFVIFGILVTSHEFGHFIIAKSGGIRVNEFFVGMGPTLWKKKKGDTLYSIKLLPIGGACVFDGMDPVEEEKESYDEHSFLNASVWRRIATLFAGPFANFIIAYILAVVLVSFSAWNFPVINELTEDSAAQEAGMQPGDKIISVDGEKVYMAGEVTLISQFAEGSPMDIIYERDGKTYETTLTPKYSEEAGRYYMGVYLGEFGEIKGPQALKYAWYEVRYYFKTTYRSLALLFKGKLSKDDVSGPVGMVKIVDDAYQETKPYGISSVILTMLSLTVLLSVNLGVMNLLPLPALDGGRLVFQFIEVIFGKKVPPEKEGFVHMIGMIALLGLMVFVLFNDITKFTR
ncbi:regulator of sigma E protease [Butyrivibrio sp. INlla18]|uniref:RIP metalloprotease RseP n=1 Tax=Butyrivibrio sp. INlla18 TaxID=1520806 RepID=UPI000887A6FE|nr:RIP metalloprotease RseP [Butyrivibrio sp. INlla18]SDA75372.1 regulator of sigma E protease [Butyrivibrio sp. INlla18]